MKIAIALIVFCGSVTLAAAQGRPQAAPVEPLFTPRFVPNAAPPPLWYKQPPVQSAREKHAPQPRRHAFPSSQQETEIICGLTVIKPSEDVDPGLLIKSKSTVHGAIRRLKPPVCTTPRH